MTFRGAKGDRVSEKDRNDWANNPNVIACPVCDVIHRMPPDRVGTKTACLRCGASLTLGKSLAVTQVVLSALTSLVLLLVVLFAPFLDLNAGQFANAATVFDALTGFTGGIMIALSWASIGFVIVLPLLRLLLLLWALVPLMFGFPPILLKNSKSGGRVFTPESIAGVNLKLGVRWSPLSTLYVAIAGLGPPPRRILEAAF